MSALDVAAAAIARGRAHAEAVGVHVAWLHGGLLETDLPAGGFDLVSAQ